MNASGPRPARRPRALYAGAVKAIAACTGAGYLTAMLLSRTGRLAAWITVTAVLLACCAVVAVSGRPPEEQHDEEDKEENSR